LLITYISDDFVKAKNKLIRAENTDDSCNTADYLSNAKEKRRIKCHKQFNTTEMSHYQNQRNKKLISFPRKLILKKKMQKKSSQMGSFNTLSLPAVPLFSNSYQTGKLYI